MRISGVTAVLTVYFDGQFWVGVAERRDCKGVCACRTVFGAEPSDEELLQWVSRTWERLPWSAAVEDAVPVPVGLAANPKRRKRKAARALAGRGPSTKAQQALAAERERAKDEAVSLRARACHEEADRRYAERAAKRKRKRRGR